MKAKPPDHQAIPIDDVHIDPANARQHPERNRATIRASLARFGAGRSIVLDANNVVRAGNGTLEQAREAGYEEVLIVEPKPGQLVAVKRADWSATEAAAYGIADNRATDLGAFDDAALASTLKALQDEAFNLGAIGYTGDEVQNLIDRLAGEIVDDPQGEWEGMPECESENRLPASQLTIYFGSDADREEFSKLIGQSLTPQTKWIWHPARKTPAGLQYVEE
jgi:hypothetical protein